MHVPTFAESFILIFVYAAYAHGMVFALVSYVDSYMHQRDVRLPNATGCKQHETLSPSVFAYQVYVNNYAHVLSIIVFAIALLFYARHNWRMKQKVRGTYK